MTKASNHRWNRRTVVSVGVLVAATTLSSALVKAQAPDPAQAPDAAARAEALAERRAERDAERAQRMPSRPVTVRDPLPLPVRVTEPSGGAPAGASCDHAQPCMIDYEVPDGKTLVVTAIWAAGQIRCDGATLGSTPAGGEPIAPQWHCRKDLVFSGKPGGGFAGFHTDAAE